MQVICVYMHGRVTSHERSGNLEEEALVEVDFLFRF